MRVLWAILTGVLLLNIMVLVFGLDPSPLAILAIGGSVVLSQVVHVYAHELGHLATALWLRFNVTAVTVLAGDGDGAQVGGATVRLGLFGSRSEVRVRVPPGRTPPRRQWIAYALGGPAANLALAAVTGVAAWVLRGQSAAGEPTTTQLCLICSTITGTAIGLANLIPGTSRRGQPTDGKLIMDWLLRPHAARRRVSIPVAVGPRNTPRLDVLAVLRSQVDIGGPQASEAAVELMAAALRVGDLAEDSERLVGVARAATTQPHVAAVLAGTVAEVQATMLLIHAKDGQHPEPGSLAEIAELAFAKDPQVVEARTALALIRVLQRRPGDARELLALTKNGPDRSGVNVLAVRAMAEADLGDPAQARRLINAGRAADLPTALLRLATTRVDRVAALEA